MSTSGRHGQRLKAITQEARDLFQQKFQVRERTLQVSREIIRHSANAIRAIHRGEFQEGRKLLEEARPLARELHDLLPNDADIYFGGFVEDAQKEFAEAHATLAFVASSALPTPKELYVTRAAYFNGLGEAVGELRRYVLDSLRRNDVAQCEELLDLMDEVYTILVTMDFPDAITRGLRRTTDMVRGVLERTRGDLTMALRQQTLERRLGEMEERLKG
ncbi:MAG: haloacid dehalogenase [Chloroflexi bacterium]|nr:haloacid dehalogenase [Chloroflexota bacterium]